VVGANVRRRDRAEHQHRHKACLGFGMRLHPLGALIDDPARRLAQSGEFLGLVEPAGDGAEYALACRDAGREEQVEELVAVDPVAVGGGGLPCPSCLRLARAAPRRCRAITRCRCSTAAAGGCRGLCRAASRAAVLPCLCRSAGDAVNAAAVGAERCGAGEAASALGTDELADRGGGSPRFCAARLRSARPRLCRSHRTGLRRFPLGRARGFLVLGIGLPLVGGTLRLKLNESIGNRAQRERT